MALELRLLQEAAADLQSAARWYEERVPGLGNSFVQEVEERLNDAIESPELFTEAMPGVRRALTGRFPYAIYYLVEDERLVVLGIFHQARSPQTWKRRAKKR